MNYGKDFKEPSFILHVNVSSLNIQLFFGLVAGLILD